MAIEQDFEDGLTQNDVNGEDKSSLEKWNFASDAVADADDSPFGGLDCNICLDTVQDPVVTLCGHLYCWPCIYKWLHFQSIPTKDQDQTQQQCPVCKAEVSSCTLVPLYGRGQTMKPSNDKACRLGMVMPKRPLRTTCMFDSPRSPSSTISLRLMPQLNYHNHSHQSHVYSQPGNYPASPMLGSGSITTNLFDSVIGMFGEMVYARVFGNSTTSMYTNPNSYHLAVNTGPRIRRHVMQADKLLNRICFFLFCCLVLCLLLF